MGIICVVALVGVALIGWRRSASASTERTQRTAEVGQGVTVKTTIVARSPSSNKLVLLGEARPYAEVTLYAKVSGYLKSVRVDRGDRVTRGEVLATIVSPETDRALSAARAEYEQRRVTAERVDRLYAKQFVSPQEDDQARADAAVARERVASLAEQQDYESLRAPLDGVVTARFADPGALLQGATSSQTSALPMLTVSQIDRLRVFVYLDQREAAGVRVGTSAMITSQDQPNLSVPASIARLSGTLDAKTRKMLAELDVDNRNGAIVPGSFLTVSLNVPVPSQPQAPAEALVVRGTTTYVAVVDAQQRIHLVPVTVASNDGKIVTFASGVEPGTRIALSLGGSVQDGAQARLAPDTSAKPAHGAQAVAK